MPADAVTGFAAPESAVVGRPGRTRAAIVDAAPATGLALASLHDSRMLSGTPFKVCLPLPLLSLPSLLASLPPRCRAHAAGPTQGITLQGRRCQHNLKQSCCPPARRRAGCHQSSSQCGEREPLRADSGGNLLRTAPSGSCSRTCCCVRVRSACSQTAAEKHHDGTALAAAIREAAIAERAATLSLSCDGFATPNFNKKLISYIQANVRVVMPGAPSTGQLSSHTPLVLGRCKDTCEVYEHVWPHVEAPFIGADGKPLTSIEVRPDLVTYIQDRHALRAFTLFARTRHACGRHALCACNVSRDEQARSLETPPLHLSDPPFF